MHDTSKLTPEQIADIRVREQKGLQALKDLQLNPSAQVVPINIGNDTFAFKIVPFLIDTKIIVEAPIPSDNPEVNPAL